MDLRCTDCKTLHDLNDCAIGDYAASEPGIDLDVPGRIATCIVELARECPECGQVIASTTIRVKLDIPQAVWDETLKTAEWKQ